MGLLDDAIREHLDLKRRHGADPADVERLEREALGPVRRGPKEPDLLDADSTASVTYYEDAEHRDSYGDPLEPQWHDQPGERDLPPSEYERRSADDVIGYEDPAAAETRPDVGKRSRRIARPSRPARWRGGGKSAQPPSDETAEFDVAGSLAAESQDAEDDVLEETPEFLQDAPEHDRLWFEQRPPRDFDFDG
jgi:hypothetical protein